MARRKRKITYGKPILDASPPLSAREPFSTDPALESRCPYGRCRHSRPGRGGHGPTPTVRPRRGRRVVSHVSQALHKSPASIPPDATDLMPGGPLDVAPSPRRGEPCSSGTGGRTQAAAQDTFDGTCALRTRFWQRCSCVRASYGGRFGWAVTAEASTMMVKSAAAQRGRIPFPEPEREPLREPKSRRRIPRQATSFCAPHRTSTS
jgi:hypothetical protein